MDNRQIAELISERIGSRPVPFEAVRTLALEIYHDLGGREDDENFADIFEILLSILPLTNLIDDTSIYLDKTWSSYKIDASLNQVITSVEDLMNFDCSTIEPTTTNFVPGTEYTVHEALQRTANLFGGYKKEIDDINALIPGQATKSNQLADKSFVNSTVATNAANFRGNWINWTAVPSNASLYPEDYVGNRTPTNNDYMMVQDASDYEGLKGSWRFIYIGDWNTTGKSGWNPQYKVGSTFTAVQQAAIDSGITATKVDTYDGYGTSITALQTDKLDKVYTGLKIYGTDTLGGQISYEAGTGISFENGKISNTNTEAAWGNITGTLSNQTDLSTALDSKQDVLTAGNNITINGTTISANDTTYSASDNIDITDNAIKAVGYRYDTTNGAFAEGDRDIVKDGTTYPKSTATGIMSHAEGSDTTASGDYSHVEGYRTTASSNYSHAEGYKTIASGTASHAGGYVRSGSISAKGDGSFAHGYTLAGSIDASGRGAVAMGYADRDTIIAKGNGAHAEGVNTNALNTGAHAEGKGTKAEGMYSHAEGINADALANASHAEGRNTTAKGDYSHAEGNSTYASEFASHAEGNQAKATGTNSHAEGQGNTGALGTVSNKVSDTQYTLSKITATILDQPFTLQVGDIVNCSSNYAKVTAINDNTITIDKNIEAKIDDTINLVKGVSYGKSSHSEGYLTAATENYAHSEGDQTSAYGIASHAEGQNTIAYGNGTHAEGISSWTLADGAHTEGGETTATGNYSHVEGYRTFASGMASHAEGKSTTAALSSVITVSTEGSNYLYELGSLTTTVSDKMYTLQVGNVVNYGTNYAKVTAITDSSITTDKDLGVKAGNTINFVIGGSYGDSAHSEGYLATAFGDYSHAEGYQTTASSNYSHVEGYRTTASGAASHAGGYVRSGSISAKGDGSFAHGYTIGGSIDASGAGAVAIGYADRNTISATGKGAHAEGVNTAALAEGAHAEGKGTKAEGRYSHAEGLTTKALASGTHAEGRNTTAEGDYSHAEGRNTIASGTASHVEGYQTTASGNYSHAEGYYTETKNQGEHASCMYNKSNNQDANAQTIFSIGIGTSNTDRKNAIEVLRNGSVYIKGIGGYDGTNPFNSSSLQDFLSSLSGGGNA